MKNKIRDYIMEMEIETKRENYNPLDNIDYGFINFLLVEGFNQDIFLDKELEFLYKLSAKDKLLENSYEKKLIEIINKYCLLETLDYKLVKKWVKKYVQMFYKEYIVSEKIYIKEEIKEQIVKLIEPEPIIEEEVKIEKVEPERIPEVKPKKKVEKKKEKK